MMDESCEDIKNPEVKSYVKMTSEGRFYMNQYVPLGYEESVCIQCSNSERKVSHNLFFSSISKCVNSFKPMQGPINIQFEYSQPVLIQGSDNFKVKEIPLSTFMKVASGCPKKCELKMEDCTTSYGG